MDQTLENIFQKQLETMQRIELFLNIYKCKAFVAEDLRGLKEEVGSAAEKLKSTKEYLEIDRKDVCSQFIEIMQKMRRNELLMLHLLEVGTNVEQNENVKPALQPFGSKQPMPLKELQNETNPSKMHLLDYSKSPFASRSKPRNIHFYDFEAEITEEEFETIPKYLKGRMQLSELKQFLECDVIKCFEEKYTLMYKHRKALVNQHDLNIWKEYNSQQANFPDEKFITQEDLSRKSGKALDKKSYAKLQMLRHLHILREVRSEGTMYFLWIYSK
ncbi:spindle and kinetochore-associated protein 1-like [Anopheles maculipalpis]|uniref:spindle and kinetochore-associated protein 1-like n=1 Tax=Anopheles maculipalpis TaxID=1496333 RepID=UPI002158FC0A|nr:spindle and kinetochore-associated protein 1-like [Anopheles maculipalpis]